MSSIINLRFHIGHTQVSLKFIVGETSAASTILGADFCDQHVKTIRRIQRFVELDRGDCIPTVQKRRGSIMSQPRLPDGLTNPKDHPRPSLMDQVARKAILPAHSQTWVLVQSVWVDTAVLHPFTSLYEITLVLTATGGECVKANAMFEILVAKM